MRLSLAPTGVRLSSNIKSSSPFDSSSCFVSARFPTYFPSISVRDPHSNLSCPVRLHTSHTFGSDSIVPSSFILALHSPDVCPSRSHLTHIASGRYNLFPVISIFDLHILTI